MKKVHKKIIGSILWLCVLLIAADYPAANSSDENDRGAQEKERNQEAPANAEKASTISVHDDQLSVELVDAQFGSVIDNVAQQSGFSVAISGDVKQKKVTTQFQNVDIERGIIRLLQLIREKNYLIHYDTKGMVSKLEVYSGSSVSSVTSRPAVSARPPGRSPARVTPAARRPTRSPDAARPRAPRRRVTRPRPRVQPEQTETINEAINNRGRSGARGDLEEPVGVVPYVPPKQ